MIRYLEQEHRQELFKNVPARCARIEVISKSAAGKSSLFQLLVDLDKQSMVEEKSLEGKHSYIDSAYMKEVEHVCMADGRIQAEIATLDLPDGAEVVVEPWAYATDGTNDMSKRISMVRMKHVLQQGLRHQN